MFCLESTAFIFIPATSDDFSLSILKIKFNGWNSVIIIINVFYITHLDICDEMLELYGGGKKKEKLEVSDEGSSSNQSSPLPASSPPAKKRVSIILNKIN